MSDLSPVTGCGHQCRSYVDRRDNRINHHVNKDAKGKLLVRLPFTSESKGLPDERSNPPVQFHQQGPQQDIGTLRGP